MYPPLARLEGKTPCTQPYNKLSEFKTCSFGDSLGYTIAPLKQNKKKGKHKKGKSKNTFQFKGKKGKGKGKGKSSKGKGKKK